MGIKTKIDIDWKGIEAKRDEAAKEILWTQGQSVITAAQQGKMVPVETGTLRRSAMVTVNKLPNPQKAYQRAKNKGKQGRAKAKDIHTKVRRVFVSYNTPYASRLHESLGWKPRNWRKTARGKVVSKPAEGGPKWVEFALAAAKPHFPAIASRVCKKVFK